MRRTLLILIGLFFNLACFGRTIIVDHNSPVEFHSIQAAINAASNGDTIEVLPGRYTENINFNGKKITVRAVSGYQLSDLWRFTNCWLLDANAPNFAERFNFIHDGRIDFKDFAVFANYWYSHGEIIVDGNGTDAVVFKLGEDASSVLDGFTITRGRYGIYCDHSSPKIMNCKVSNNGSYGIYCAWSTSTITDCKIENNKNQAGIYCKASSPLIKGCRIIGCQYGISSVNYEGFVTSFSRPTIRNCVIAKNICSGLSINPEVTEISNCTIYGNGNYGISCNSTYGNIKNCILWNNYGSTKDDLNRCSATYSCIEEISSGQGNIHINPMFINTDSNDFHLWYSSPSVNAGDPCSGYINEPDYPHGHIDMGVYGNTSEATGIIDDDNDGIADQWELLYWPGDDPNQHDANENLDGDKFNNLVEYMFKYDPGNKDTNVPMTMSRVDLSTNKFDPTKHETVTVKYMLNMDANVVINFTDPCDSNYVVKTTRHLAKAGVTQTAAWDGKDSNGLIFEKKYYNISIDANDGKGNIVNRNPGKVQLYYDHGITGLVCNPRRVITTYNEISTVSYNIACDANVIVSVYDPCNVLFLTLLNNVRQQKLQNPQKIVWSPRQGGPSDPNSKYISKEGLYEVEVKFLGMREKARHNLGVYR